MPSMCSVSWGLAWCGVCQFMHRFWSFFFFFFLVLGIDLILVLGFHNHYMSSEHVHPSKPSVPATYSKLPPQQPIFSHSTHIDLGVIFGTSLEWIGNLL
jgi:hypothetical protein